MASSPLRVESVAAYLDVIHKIVDRWSDKEPRVRRADDESFWYRGQHDLSWGLSPRLYRPEFEGADETEIRHEFESMGAQVIRGRMPSNRWEWYFLMQHYGIPTRLLDWTRNPLVALFFAVANHSGKTDAAVWALDPNHLNIQNPYLRRQGVEGMMLSDWVEAQKYLHSLEDSFSGDEIRVKYPAAIEPPLVDQRLVVQASCFVVFGTQRDLAKPQPKGRPATRLVSMRIPKQKIGHIYDELGLCGVTPLSVFPDLEGLAKNIVSRWVKL